MATGSSSADAGRYAVLLVAYGSPRTLEEVEPYLLDVRGGRPVSRAMVEELQARYAAIGGSPLLERTMAQARALASTLGVVDVFVGMRHWHPFIAESLAAVRKGGHRRVVWIAMAPHYSRMSVGAYRQRIDAVRGSVEVMPVRPWHTCPGFCDAVAAKVTQALDRFPPQRRNGVKLVFTAHSLPARIVGEGDPYPEHLAASVAGVLARLECRTARIAYQSAGRTDEAWLGPDARDVVEELATEGVRDILVCPIGFVSDHLEILYDLDIELVTRARDLGVRLERTESLNDDPLFIAALADLVRDASERAGWA
jgi:ferrochelatase